MIRSIGKVDMLESYLRDAAMVRSAGVKETSFYPALAALFDGVGKTLKPRVRCIIHPAGKGAGLPDGGFFTPDQLRGDPDTFAAMKATLLPARGVLEVKGAADDAPTIARSPQVAKYLDRYGLVLVTNLRDFLLVEAGPDGAATVIDRYTLAPTEAAFWEIVAHPHDAVQTHGATFADFLARAMRTAAPLTRPEDVAWFLASYARDARFQLEGKGLPALASIRTALEDALGLHFRGEQGDHFFLSTFLQTLFYGVFSAWVLWHTERPSRTDRFEWRMSEWYLRVPVIAALFETLATRRTLEPLGLLDTLDRTAAVLNRVQRDAFFAHFEEENAVQYFYEPFLRAFDPQLREQLGVWYTPPEIVRYMVARADAAVRDELGIPLGLADPRVQVLDPCCGTGAYLVEVVKLIAARLDAGGGDALSGNDLKHAALARVFGFEILPAPYVVAHLQLGLLLARLGAPLDDSTSERVGVYLTNALTGWHKEAGEAVPLPTFPELAQERDAAARVKQDAPILVVIGNPPYNGFAGAAADEEGDLSHAYRVAKRTRQPQGQGLNDLYVRFFRAAERRIVDGTGSGVVCFISNYSWLDGLSFTAMRERYMDVFDHIEIDNLNGDKYRTGKVTPEGLPDPSAFSTATNREGIQVGTAVALLVRREEHTKLHTVRYREWWGQGKRAALLASLTGPDAAPYCDVVPPNALGLPFAPAQVGAAYEAWPLLPDLFPASFPGVQTKRDDVVVDIDRDRLVQRMEAYFDPRVSDEQMRRIAPGAFDETARFDPIDTRRQLQARGFLSQYVVKYMYRPFDIRWVYWEPKTRLLGEKSPAYFPQVFAGNMWIEARQKQTASRFDRGYFTQVLADNFGNGFSSFFPLLVRPITKTLFDVDSTDEPRPNLSDRARACVPRGKRRGVASGLASRAAPCHGRCTPGIRCTRQADCRPARCRNARIRRHGRHHPPRTAAHRPSASRGGREPESGSRRPCSDGGMGAWRERCARDARARQGYRARIHARRARRTRSGQPRCPHPARSYLLRRVPERCSILGMCPGGRLAIHHRWLSGAKEVAIVPRASRVGARPTCGGSPRGNSNDPPHRRPAVARPRAGRELRECVAHYCGGHPVSVTISVR